ncbi:MAG TPA: LysM peptidoglycan-binding domain-containing protein [Chloroflexota bacterium]|nr:LysM peptidoglycan-binding domain-containing protein [Chloroflexota bacterium]
MDAAGPSAKPEASTHAGEHPHRALPHARLLVWVGATLLLAAGLIGLRLWVASHSASLAEVTESAPPITVAAQGDIARATPPALPSLRNYTVMAGDSLTSIAAAFDTTPDAVSALNDLDDPDVISIGQELMVPAEGSTLVSADPTADLSSIARSYGLDPALLAAYNGLDASRIDQPLGRTGLLVPLEVAGQSAAASLADSSASSATYTVVEGDSLLSIAAQLNVDPDDLASANDIADPDLIVAGDELRIPGN